MDALVDYPRGHGRRKVLLGSIHRFWPASDCLADLDTGGDHLPGQVQPGQQRHSSGISLVLAATARWPSTTPESWSTAARRCTCDLSSRNAPRTILLSTATAGARGRALLQRPQWTPMPSGGHLFPVEEPDRIALDIAAFLAAL